MRGDWKHSQCHCVQAALRCCSGAFYAPWRIERTGAICLCLPSQSWRRLLASKRLALATLGDQNWPGERPTSCPGSCSCLVPPLGAEARRRLLCKLKAPCGPLKDNLPTAPNPRTLSATTAQTRWDDTPSLRHLEISVDGGNTALLVACVLCS